MKISSSKFFRNREHGDDRFLRYKKDNVFVFTVLDGVSSASGAAASQLARKWMKRKKPNNLHAVTDTLNEFHAWITGKIGNQAQTTVSVALIHEGKLSVASVGDSPVYLVDANEWSISQVNELDSWEDDPAVVTQVLGADDIDINKVEIDLPAKGYILLCTDGISDNLSMEDLLGSCVDMPRAQTVIRRVKKSMKKLRKEGKGHVYDEFKPDDQTIIAVKFSKGKNQDATSQRTSK